MMLNELINLIIEKRREINKEKMEKELREVLEQLSQLRDSLEKVREIKTKLILCEEEVKEIKDEILSSSEPSAIVQYVNMLYTTTLNCYKRKEEERRRKIEEEKKKVEELNGKLILYKKVFKNVFGENVEIYLLNDRAEDLEKEIQKGEEQIKMLYDKLREKVGNKSDSLIQLIYSGEIEINKDNYSEVFELIKFLIERGMTVSIRLSK